MAHLRSGANAPSRNDRAWDFLKRADGKIAQPQIGVAAFFPDTKQRPVQRLPQQVVALAHGDADALAEIAALDKRPAREGAAFAGIGAARSEEHTSELQSRGHLVCRLLL